MAEHNNVARFSNDIVVGIDNELNKIKGRLAGDPPELDVLSIVGMGGIGKTTLARKVYDDPLIARHFDVHMWTTLSPKYELIDILLGLVHIVCKSNITKINYLESIEDVGEQLRKGLKKRRYLCVIDDIWNVEAWKKLRVFLPNDCNGSRIILTSRDVDVVKFANPNYPPHELSLMDPETSWELLSKKVFLRDDCPDELVVIGKSIALKCQGLPLAINLVAGHLSKVGRTSLDWLNVEKQLPSFQENGLDILALSYNYLPVRLKKCFIFAANEYSESSMRLYGRKQFQMVRRHVTKEMVGLTEKRIKKLISLFSPKRRSQHEGFRIPMQKETRPDLKLGISTKALMSLWIAAGYIDAESPRSLEDVAEECLQELISRNLLMVTNGGSSGRPKSYIVHDLMVEMCRRLDGEQVRRSGSYIDDFYNFVSIVCDENNNNWWSKLSLDGERYSGSDGYRELFNKFSLLVSDGNNNDGWLQMRYAADSAGQLDSYSHGIHPFALFGSNEYISDRLLQAMRENFSVAKRENLKHLEISTSSTIPTTVYKLCNLQTLINLHAYPCQTLRKDIWMMSQLRHLHVGDMTCLPSPRQSSHTQEFGIPILRNLVSVTFSSASCTQEICEGIPNITRLKLFEVGAECNVMEQSHNCLNNLFFLAHLQTLRLSLQNPPRCLRHWKNPPPSLRTLTLSGSCLAKEDIVILTTLPNLEVLKLKDIEVQGRVLEHDGYIFDKLRFLLLECHVLCSWKAEINNFPNLQHLVLRNCFILYEIPLIMGEICNLQVIQLYSCTDTAEDSARKIQEEQLEMGNEDFLLHIGHSYNR